MPVLYRCECGENLQLKIRQALLDLAVTMQLIHSMIRDRSEVVCRETRSRRMYPALCFRPAVQNLLIQRPSLQNIGLLRREHFIELTALEIALSSHFFSDGYARETVIAEKFQAMVALGRANSRMKDFYDIWILCRSFSFDDDRLARAIAATFARRGTPIPVDRPDALSAAFAADELKQQQWRAFLEDAALNPGTLTDVTDDLAAFLMPHAGSAAKLGR